jgi:hypothetical protein
MIGLEDLRKATKRMKDTCNKLIEKIQVSRLWSTDRTLENIDNHVVDVRIRRRDRYPNDSTLLLHTLPG